MNIFFPQVNAALVVRKTRPRDAKFVTGLGKESAYAVPAQKRPRGCEVAQGPLGGWNFADGVCVHLVYAKTLSAIFRYRAMEYGEWLTKPRQLPNGLFCALIMTHTKMPVSIGVTPVLAEEALAEAE